MFNGYKASVLQSEVVVEIAPEGASLQGLDQTNPALAGTTDTDEGARRMEKGTRVREKEHLL